MNDAIKKYIADKAAKEYAQQQAIAFAEWVSARSYYKGHLERWYNPDKTVYGVPEMVGTSEELYQLFLKSQG